MKTKQNIKNYLWNFIFEYFNLITVRFCFKNWAVELMLKNYRYNKTITGVLKDKMWEETYFEVTPLHLWV